MRSSLFLLIGFLVAFCPEASAQALDHVSGFAGVVDARRYGCVGDGTTDNSTCVSFALSALSAAGGGTLSFSPGTYRINSQVVLPNTVGSPSPTQKNIRITAAGGGPNWYANYAPNAVILDLRYASTGGKIETLGRGTLVIDGLTLKDGGTTNSTPFIHTTNTTLSIERNTFIGVGNATQDAIVLGGTVASLTSDTTGAFQGYGTVINANTFSKLNRGVYARTYANAVVITNNNWIENTGTRAIECDGSVAVNNGNFGLTVTGNTIEMETYVYGIVLTACRYSLFGNNSFWDPGVQVVNNYYLDTLSTANTFIAGVGSIGQVKTYADFGGEATSLALSNMLGYPNHTADSTAQGEAANELAGNLVVKGSYRSGDAYPGQLTLANAFGTTSRISLGYDGSTDTGVLTVKTGALVRLFDLNPNGPVRMTHPVAGGAAPTVADTTSNSCGSGAQTIAGADGAGRVTVIGSSGTSCTVTFGLAWATKPVCLALNETAGTYVPVTTTTTTMVLAATFGQNDVIAYWCEGY